MRVIVCAMPHVKFITLMLAVLVAYSQGVIAYDETNAETSDYEQYFVDDMIHRVERDVSKYTNPPVTADSRLDSTTMRRALRRIGHYLRMHKFEDFDRRKPKDQKVYGMIL